MNIRNYAIVFCAGAIMDRILMKIMMRKTKKPSVETITMEIKEEPKSDIDTHAIAVPKFEIDLSNMEKLLLDESKIMNDKTQNIIDSSNKLNKKLKYWPNDDAKANFNNLERLADNNKHFVHKKTIELLESINELHELLKSAKVDNDKPKDEFTAYVPTSLSSAFKHLSSTNSKRK